MSSIATKSWVGAEGCLYVHAPKQETTSLLLPRIFVFTDTLSISQPPPSFQPVQPPPSSTPTRPAPPPPKSSHPDLITRYNLASRISAASQPEGAAPEEEEASKPQVTWSQSKAERQALLQKRREDMVLAARRKMEQRERERAKGKAKEV